MFDSQCLRRLLTHHHERRLHGFFFLSTFYTVHVNDFGVGCHGASTNSPSCPAFYRAGFCAYLYIDYSRSSKVRQHLQV